MAKMSGFGALLSFGRHREVPDEAPASTLPPPPTPDDVAAVARELVGLSADRKLEIETLARRGCREAEIAERVGVSAFTVREYLRRTYPTLTATL